LCTGFLISVALPDGWARDDPIFNGVADLQFQFNTECVVFAFGASEIG